MTEDAAESVPEGGGPAGNAAATDDVVAGGIGAAADATVGQPAPRADRGAVRVALAAVASVLAVMAQVLLTTKMPVDKPVLVISVVLYAVAIIAFLGLAHGWSSARGTEAVPGRAHGTIPGASDAHASLRGIAGRLNAFVRSAAVAMPLRAAATVIALGVSLFVVAVLFARGDVGETYVDVFVLWLCSICLYVLAFVWPQSRAAVRRIKPWGRAHREAIRDAGLLFAASLLLRVLFVGTIPDVLGGDEALVGLVARGLLESPGNMFSTAFAYSNVYHLAVAAPIKILGSTATAVRLLGAILSAAAVPLCYLAGREMFGRRVGLVAGVLLLASHQHVHMSRTGHAHGVDAFVVALVLFTFSRGLRRRSLPWMAVAGVGLGTAQYVYVGARAIDLVIAAFVVVLAVVDWPRLRASLPGVAAAFGASFVTAGPMIVWAIRRPGDYMTRLNQTGLVQSGAAEDRLAEGTTFARLLLDQTYHAFLAPIAYPTASFYDARLPMVDALWACLFVLGLALAVRRLRDWRYLLLLTAFLGTSMSILVMGNLVQVSNYRITGALPVFALLAGVSLVVLFERGLSGLGLPESWPVVAGAAVVAVIAGYNTGYYFLDHVRGCGYMANDDATAAVSLASKYIAEHEPETIVVAVTEPSYTIGSYPNGAYLTGRSSKMGTLGSPEDPQPGDEMASTVIYHLPAGGNLQAVAEQLEGHRPVLFWVSPFAEGNHRIDDIEAVMPGGTRTTLERCGEALVYLYRLPRRDDLAD